MQHAPIGDDGLDGDPTVRELKAAMATLLGKLDGTRMFNAATALGVAPQEIARFTDTVSVCLSKGLSASAPQTNIVQVDVSDSGRDSRGWVEALEAAGVRVRPRGRSLLRVVFHRHIGDADVARAVSVFASVAPR